MNAFLGVQVAAASSSFVNEGLRNFGLRPFPISTSLLPENSCQRDSCAMQERLCQIPLTCGIVELHIIKGSFVEALLLCGGEGARTDRGTGSSVFVAYLESSIQ